MCDCNCNCNSTKKLKVKKLYKDSMIKLPERANPTDSGADIFIYRFIQGFFNDIRNLDNLTQKCSITLLPNDRVMVGTGIAATYGKGFEIQVRPRSGNSVKKGLIVTNTPGTIDESYRGEICVIISNIGHHPQTLTIGDKIAQLVICPIVLCDIEEVDSLDETERGAGGFGHTGF